jgi:glutamate N-acetyltransferase/amino-acid N-acetyltransferase
MPRRDRDDTSVIGLTHPRFILMVEQPRPGEAGRVIGVHLDMTKLERGIAVLRTAAAERSAAAAARAIMTTDTKPKTAQASVTLGGRTVRIAGFAKGSGMIHPRMATMLAVIATDAALAPAEAQAALGRAANRSFNRISVDGDTSTNDTVLLLASGVSGVRIEGGERAGFDAALSDVCVSLARQIARDGEGATRLVEVTVSGAATEEAAHTVADAIARSPLVKTAIHGGDPNWGRLIAVAGRAGVAFELERAAVSIGSTVLFKNGRPHDELAPQAAENLKGKDIAVAVSLGAGSASSTVWTCDLSAEYVRINADYRT